MHGWRRIRFGRRHGRRWWWRVWVLMLVPVMLALTLAVHCRPVVMEFAKSDALWMAERAANDAVSEVLERYAALCRSMIQVSYNEQQILSSVITDTAAVNTIRTAIGSDIMEQMEHLTTMRVSVPLGSLLGPKILSGWGPLLHFPMSVSATVLSTVSSSLTAAGINQSTYQVLVNVRINLVILTSGGRSGVTLETAFPMAEAVLLGKVPDALTEVYGDNQDVLGKIFDYGAEE